MRMNRRWTVITGLLVIGIAVSAGAAVFPWQSTLPVWNVRVIASYPHDPAAFSQGLVIANGQLYEGTGQYGHSSLRKVSLTTGEIERQIPLSREYFGEGIAVLGDKLYQLTWKERLALVYDIESLRPVGSFRYTGEGWGLTTDGQELILSDGSAILRFLNPETFEVTRRVEVKDGRRRVDKLNELEFVDGEILANLWYSDRIARISPKTGQVLGWIDASGLYPAATRPSREHVLNGIAYDADAKRLYLTGKNWPRLYHVELIRPGN